MEPEHQLMPASGLLNQLPVLTLAAMHLLPLHLEVLAAAGFAPVLNDYLSNGIQAYHQLPTATGSVQGVSPQKTVLEASHGKHHQCILSAAHSIDKAVPALLPAVHVYTNVQHN